MEYNTESEKTCLLGKASRSLNLVHGKMNMVRYTWKKKKKKNINCMKQKK